MSVGVIYDPYEEIANRTVDRLHGENAELRAEIDRLRAERDAARADAAHWQERHRQVVADLSRCLKRLAVETFDPKRLPEPLRPAAWELVRSWERDLAEQGCSGAIGLGVDTGEAGDDHQ